MLVNRTLMMSLATLYFALPAYSYSNDRREGGRYPRQNGHVRFDEGQNQVRRFRRDDPPERVGQSRRPQTRTNTHEQSNTNRHHQQQTRSGNNASRSRDRVANNNRSNRSTSRTQGGSTSSRNARQQTSRSSRSGSRPTQSRGAKQPKKVKSPYKGMGKAGGALVAGGLAAGTWQALQQNEEDYKAGRISKTQYQQTKRQQLLDGAAGLAALKKLNAPGMVLNDVIGTDPFSLGADVLGDLLNGTDNTKKTLQNMGNAFDKSLVKQTLTDPKGAAKRVGDDLKDAGRKVGDGLKKVGDLFKKK